VAWRLPCINLAKDLGNIAVQYLHPEYLGRRSEKKSQNPMASVAKFWDYASLRQTRHGLFPVGWKRQRQAAALHRVEA